MEKGLIYQKWHQNICDCLGNTNASMKRRYPRAPLNARILYANGQSVYQGVVINIGVEGALLQTHKPIPLNATVSLIIPLKYYATFEHLPIESLHNITTIVVPRTIIKAQAQIIRIANHTTTVMGCQFTKISKKERNLVETYIKLLSANILFLIKLFETPQLDESRISLLLTLAKFLDYGPNHTLKTIRSKALHDYQSTIL